MVLDGLKLHLHQRFEVLTAPGGPEGVEMLRYNGPFAVVVSDMRMPGMSGAEFLAQALVIAPDTVRILLTGHAELDSAIAAVNEGRIFRFLCKPCPPPLIVKALGDAVEQNRLILAERVLLEQTLAGSIKMLTEVLSLANPIAFGRAVQLKRLVSQLCDRMEIEPRWHIEAAAQLSQIGCITLPPEVAEKLYFGRDLTESEQALADRVPATADQLLASIPRLEPVREVLALMSRRFDGGDGSWAKKGKDLPVGARILRLVGDYDRLQASGLPAAEAMGLMAQREGLYDPNLFEGFRAMIGNRTEQVRELPLFGLRPGMVFVDDVRSRGGTLIVARGHAVTQGLIERMKNFGGQIKEPLRVVEGS